MSSIEVYKSKFKNGDVILSSSVNGQISVIKHLLDSIVKLNPSFIAIDVEVSPKTKSHAWVGVTDGDKTWIFWLDDETEGKDIFIKILEHNTIIKVFHDFEADKRLLSPWIKFEAKRVFDTQLCALLKSQPLSMDSLCEIYDVGKKTKAKNNHRDLWTGYSLSDEEIEYLLNDVRITHKLARAILNAVPLTRRDKYNDFDTYVEEVISWLVHKEGRPLDYFGLIAFIQNSSPIAKYISGDQKEDLSIKIIEELKNRRIITVSNVGKIVYTTTPELQENAAKKLRPHLCFGCADVNVKKPNGLCALCITKLRISNPPCNDCNEKFSDIILNGIRCKTCFENGILRNCDLCRRKYSDILNGGVSCLTCYKEEKEKENIGTSSKRDDILSSRMNTSREGLKRININNNNNDNDIPNIFDTDYINISGITYKKA